MACDLCGRNPCGTVVRSPVLRVCLSHGHSDATGTKTFQEHRIAKKACSFLDIPVCATINHVGDYHSCHDHWKTSYGETTACHPYPYSLISGHHLFPAFTIFPQRHMPLQYSPPPGFQKSFVDETCGYAALQRNQKVCSSMSFRGNYRRCNIKQSPHRPFSLPSVRVVFFRLPD